MKTVLLVIIAIIVIVAGLFFVFNNNEVQEGGEVTVAQGIITDINLDRVAVDGPAVITIDTASGGQTIQVSSFGLLTCMARENIVDVFTLEVGDTIEVSGEVMPNGDILPCESDEHYLRVVGAN